MLINGKRALAYVQTVHDIQPIVGADNIELIHVLGWNLIAKKGEFKAGDKCIYIEIDSKVPETNPVFEFLAAKGFKVKTMKLGKFGVISQGLAMPITLFKEIPDDIKVDTDVTELLGITYTVAEDNIRKDDNGDLSLTKFKIKHKKFFSSKLGRFLMKHTFTRNIVKKLFCKKSDSKKTRFPLFINKTDEERIQNIPFALADKTPVIVTEKIDGTSTTYAVERKHHKFEFYCCSRNRRLLPEESNSSSDHNYWLIEKKYDIKNRLIAYLKEHSYLSWVALQGETFGPSICGNMLKQKEIDFRAFNFIDSKDGRFGSVEGAEIVGKWGMAWVPILYIDYVLPDTVDEIIKEATGCSYINSEVLREGWVIRSKDGKQSFKAVSSEYLLKKKE